MSFTPPRAWFNYAYDRFWVVLRLSSPDGEPLFADTDREAEPVVRIYEREERLSWPVPPSLRAR